MFILSAYPPPNHLDSIIRSRCPLRHVVHNGRIVIPVPQAQNVSITLVLLPHHSITFPVQTLSNSLETQGSLFMRDFVFTWSRLVSGIRTCPKPAESGVVFRVCFRTTRSFRLNSTVCVVWCVLMLRFFPWKRIISQQALMRCASNRMCECVWVRVEVSNIGRGSSVGMVGFCGGCAGFRHVQLEPTDGMVKIYVRGRKKGKTWKPRETPRGLPVLRDKKCS